MVSVPMRQLLAENEIYREIYTSQNKAGDQSEN